jgi:hypothetical protein
VTVKRNDKTILETDYMQGIGYAPAYKASVAQLGHANSLMRFEALQQEAETGKRYNWRSSTFTIGGPLDPPSAADVLYSLSMDASALDHPTFEDWAADNGYDPDSREGERIYRACLETGLKLRAAIGDAGLEALRDAFQDY